MKSIISTTVFKSTGLVESIIRMVSNHNQGYVTLTSQSIYEKARAYYNEWPKTTGDLTVNSSSTSCELFELDEKLISLEWKEVTELETPTEMDLATVNS